MGLAGLGLFLLPLISVGMMYFSQKVLSSTNYMQAGGGAQQQQMMKTMMMFMPLISLWIGFTFPAAMSIYFISSSFFFAIASIFMNRRFKKIFAKMRADMEERDRLREIELEAKRQETARLRALNATRENKGTSKKKKNTQEREKERRRLAANRADQDNGAEADEDPSRVGHRKFARGRAYDPDRFAFDSEESLDEEEREEEDHIPELEDQVLEAEDSPEDEDAPEDEDFDDEENFPEDGDFLDDDFQDDEEDFQALPSVALPEVGLDSIDAPEQEEDA